METQFNAKDVIVMKLLHYFITDQNYNPVVLHGAENEIWLENMDSEYKIIRIVSNYIHNNEQLDFDLFKTKRIVKSIKKKTFNLNMDVLSIFIDLGDNVTLKDENHINCISIKEESDLKKYDFLYTYFPNIDNKLEFNEKGINLFLKITDEINQKNKKEAEKADEIFTPKTPIVTYIIIALNVLVFLYGFLFGKSNFLINEFSTYGPLIRLGEYYRLLTGAFIHVDIFHILFNMYALYTIGSQAESFFGKGKYIAIYLFSAITGSLLSIIFNLDTASIGASGAIFGIFGAMIYFGYHYRVYLGNTLLRQLVPIVILNLLLGFMLNGVDNFAHIGGLVGGLLLAMAVGLKFKTKKQEQINGIIISILYVAFLIFMNFIYIR